MPSLNIRESVSFLTTGFEPEDWIAVFMKRYRTSETVQRVVPLATARSLRFLRWLRSRNAAGWEIYCGTNAVAPGQRSRARSAIRAVRHVFLEADRDGQAVLARISARSDLPSPTYVFRTSPDRVHALWRAKGFSVDQVEGLQKRLARELGGDLAATSAAQMTRLPGFLNRKRTQPFPVMLCCGAVRAVFGPSNFPAARSTSLVAPAPRGIRGAGIDTIARARAYLTSVPPAIEGERGDVHTFRVCCRVARGFALDDEEAMAALSDWNARCQPPWSERELLAKLCHARRYGREPIGGLIAGRQQYIS